MISKPNEARRELESLAGRQTRPYPAEMLVDQVLRVTVGADFPVQRAALEAALRRFAAASREGLKVAGRPGGGEPFGRFPTRRPREPVRPYETLLRGVAPLDASCGCRDFVRNSLGLCKHVAAVLLDLAGRPRVWQRALDGAASPRGLLWDPVRPLTGDDDWMDRVRLQDEPRKGAAWKRVRARFEEHADGVRRLRPAKGKVARKGVVDDLSSVRTIDPALRALLAEEKRRLAAVGGGAGKPSLRGLKRPLYPYQCEGVERFFREGVLLLGDDMGLGKSAQATAACHALFRAGRVRRGLLIVPASLKPQWVREWQMFTDVPIALVDGSPGQRSETYRSTERGFLVANYEQVLRDLDLMRDWEPGIVVLDEAQRIKNWATKTAARVKSLRPRYRLVLTGTPMENRLEELASLMDWVDDRALEPKWRLAPWHTVFADGSREIVGARNLDTLRSRIRHRVLRRTRAEVLGDLPPRTDTVVPVAMTEEQGYAHDDLAQPIARLMQTSRRRPLTQPEFLRLMQLLTTQRIIANGLAQANFGEVWSSLDERGPAGTAALKALDSPKLLELREIVGQLAVEQQRKVVVFSQWRRMLQLAHWAVSDVVAGAGVRAAFFSGKESPRRRTQNVVEFHDDPATRLLFCTDAGGVGLNLQRAASCCVNLDLPWNPAVLEQRIARIHRIGQKQPIEVYNLVSLDSIEERIATLVRDKKAMFDGLFDGASDEILFDGAGSFLGRLRDVLDLEEEEAEPSADDEVIVDQSVDRVLAAADESVDEEPAAPARAWPAAALPGVRVERTAEGAMRIEAEPEAAEALAGLFEAMAGMLRAQNAPARGAGDRTTATHVR